MGSAPCSMITKEYKEDPTAADAVCKSTEKLFRKYISSYEATLEINISSAVRTELKNIFDGEMVVPETNSNASECERIMPSMEEACEQISRLMLDRITDSGGLKNLH